MGIFEVVALSSFSLVAKVEFRKESLGKVRNGKISCHFDSTKFLFNWPLL